MTFSRLVYLPYNGQSFQLRITWKLQRPIRCRQLRGTGATRECKRAERAVHSNHIRATIGPTNLEPTWQRVVRLLQALDSRRVGAWKGKAEGLVLGQDMRIVLYSSACHVVDPVDLLTQQGVVFGEEALTETKPQQQGKRREGRNGRGGAVDRKSEKGTVKRRHREAGEEDERDEQAGDDG
ncbi:unnamed protein product [Closterium sp. NIES-64]|nr:unnamed protein product [Closterium sp. NIES-64]